MILQSVMLSYVTVFAKRDHLGANFNFEFCIRCEGTLDELPVALYCASLAGSVSEIRLRKVWNYEKCDIKKTALNGFQEGLIRTKVIRRTSKVKEQCLPIPLTGELDYFNSSGPLSDVLHLCKPDGELLE